MEYAKTPFAVGGTTTWIGDVANQAGCLRLLTLDAWWCDLQPWLMAWSMSVDEHPTKLYIVVPAALHEIHWNTPQTQDAAQSLHFDQWSTAAAEWRSVAAEARVDSRPPVRYMPDVGGCRNLFCIYFAACALWVIAEIADVFFCLKVMFKCRCSETESRCILKPGSLVLKWRADVGSWAAEKIMISYDLICHIASYCHGCKACHKALNCFVECDRILPCLAERLTHPHTLQATKSVLGSQPLWSIKVLHLCCFQQDSFTTNYSILCIIW